MTGQIPKYGQHFRHERAIGYHRELGQALYVLKADPSWFIRSDKTSKRWQVFYAPSTRMRNSATPMGRVQPNMRGAMALLLTGIEQGYYAIDDLAARHARLTNLAGLPSSHQDDRAVSMNDHDPGADPERDFAEEAFNRQLMRET